MTTDRKPVLRVAGARKAFMTPIGGATIVDGIDLTAHRGKIDGLDRSHGVDA